MENTNSKNNPGRLQTLSAGSITPGGWMGRHMKEDANGWVRICDAMSRAGIWSLYSDPEGLKGPFYQPYLERKGAPIAGEYQAHWLDAAIWLGYVGGSRECRAMADICVQDLLAYQSADGYIGVEPPQRQFSGTGQDCGWYETWGYCETLMALMHYYARTNDQAVLVACRRASDLMIAVIERGLPAQLNFYWAANIATAFARLYLITWEKVYLDAAIAAQDKSRQGLMGPFLKLLEEKKPLVGHSAGLAILALALIELYRASGDRKWLDHAIYMHDALTKEHLQPHGSPSGMGESLAGTGPHVDTELCGTFWWIWVWTELLKETGEAKYADYAEKAALNALPGQRAKDGLVTAYFMNPNQLVALQKLKNHYPARLYVECCQSNAPRAVPLMAENMVLATPDNGLALAYYGGGEARCALASGVEVILRQESDYPFGDSVNITLQIGGGKAGAHPSAKFPLLVRIPGWSQGASIAVNGKKMEQDCPAGSWVRLEREWADGDRLTLMFPAIVKANVWEQDGERGVVLDRGPLVYALPVRGDRQLLDVWGTFEERVSRESVWNYALMLDEQNPASSVDFKRLASDSNGHLWENPPVALEVKARCIPEWKFDVPPPSAGLQGRRPKAPVYNDLFPEIEGGDREAPRAARLPQREFTLSDKVETIQLVPYGFTLLRMAYLPVVKA